MATQGRVLDDETIERIKADYAETGNLHETARRSGVSVASVKKYARADDEFEQLRMVKRADFIETLYAVRALYAEHLLKPHILAAASASDAARIVGIFTDKIQLLSGGSTERIEHVTGDDARNRLAGRLDELSARRAARRNLQSDGSGG